MKKLLTFTAILFSAILYVQAQKVTYKTTGYSEKDNGSWTPKAESKIEITVNPDDSYIEVGLGDPQIFQITKKNPPRSEGGEQVTEYICSDNEAQECKVQVVKNSSGTKIIFIYPEYQYYYTA